MKSEYKNITIERCILFNFNQNDTKAEQMVLIFSQCLIFG